tara:strand:+ start:1528 stop:1743 length:216 start_codon:yes stop_codon:yes gene_type:complete
MENKTSSYQRKAYKDYLVRKKNNPDEWQEFQTKLKASQKSYYQRNKEKILARKKEQYAQKKLLNVDGEISP